MTDPRLAALFATPVEPAQLTSRVSAHPKHGLVQQCLTVLDEQAQVKTTFGQPILFPAALKYSANIPTTAAGVRCCAPLIVVLRLWCANATIVRSI